MMPYYIPKLPDFFTLPKLFENHTLLCTLYHCSLYVGVASNPKDIWLLKVNAKTSKLFAPLKLEGFRCLYWLVDIIYVQLLYMSSLTEYVEETFQTFLGSSKNDLKESARKLTVMTPAPMNTMVEKTTERRSY